MLGLEALEPRLASTRLCVDADACFLACSAGEGFFLEAAVAELEGSIVVSKFCPTRLTARRVDDLSQYVGCPVPSYSSPSPDSCSESDDGIFAYFSTNNDRFVEAPQNLDTESNHD